MRVCVCVCACVLDSPLSFCLVLSLPNPWVPTCWLLAKWILLQRYILHWSYKKKHVTYTDLLGRCPVSNRKDRGSLW